MSIIGDRLRVWLKANTSIMRQEAMVCDRFPEHTRDAMISISEDSASKNREMGATITIDYTLGKVITGTRERVPVPRPENTIGTFHTHPFGWARPSTYDLLDSMSKDDKVMCIGASGKPGTKIQCFTPKEPKWSELRYKLRLLEDDINDFNRDIGVKYRQRGVDLRRLLDRVGSKYYVTTVSSMPVQTLSEDVEKTKRSAVIAETAARVANTRMAEANEAVRIARAELDAATTDEQRRKAKYELSQRIDEAKRATDKVAIERELADKAKIAATEAVIKSQIREQGITTADSDDAAKYIQVGIGLERRRQRLIDELNKQLLYLGYKEEWRPQRKVDGWEAEPTIMDSCRIIWEGFEEELPYEL